MRKIIIVNKYNLAFIKAIILTTTILFLTTNMVAQDSWVIKLPDEGVPKKIIQVNDGNYTTLSLVDWDETGTGYNKIGLCNYNKHGELLWNKKISFRDSISHVINDFIQLNNGDYMLCGFIANLPALIKISNLGDTIWSKTYEHLDSKLNICKLIQVSPNTILTHAYVRGEFDNYFYYIDTSGFVTRTDSSLKDVGNISNFILLNNNNILLTYSNDNDEVEYAVHDLDLVYKFRKIHNVVPILIREINDGFIIHDYYNYYSNEKGLVKLDQSLDSLWAVPFNSYYPYTGICETPVDLIQTNDLGFAMCGTLSAFDRVMIYLFKTDQWGNPEIIKVYEKYVADYITNIIEHPDDGYLMLQSKYFFEHNDIFLVKTESDGTVNVDELNKYNDEYPTVYPIPFQNHINVQLNEPFTGNISVVSIEGNLLFQRNIHYQTKIELNLDQLSDGYYILNLNGKNKVYNKKIIKRG